MESDAVRRRCNHNFGVGPALPGEVGTMRGNMRGGHSPGPWKLTHWCSDVRLGRFKRLHRPRHHEVRPSTCDTGNYILGRPANHRELHLARSGPSSRKDLPEGTNTSQPSLLQKRAIFESQNKSSVGARLGWAFNYLMRDTPRFLYTPRPTRVFISWSSIYEGLGGSIYHGHLTVTVKKRSIQIN